MICKVIDYGCLNFHDMANPKTMKVEGQLEGVCILLLIDSGASHNFLFF